MPRVNIRRQSAWYKDGEPKDFSPSDSQVSPSCAPAAFAFFVGANQLPLPLNTLHCHEALPCSACAATGVNYTVAQKCGNHGFLAAWGNLPRASGLQTAMKNGTASLKGADGTVLCLAT